MASGNLLRQVPHFHFDYGFAWKFTTFGSTSTKLSSQICFGDAGPCLLGKHGINAC